MHLQHQIIAPTCDLKDRRVQIVTSSDFSSCYARTTGVHAFMLNQPKFDEFLV